MGHDRMRAGWTEWAYFDPITGELIGKEETALAHLGPASALNGLLRGEMATEAGHAALEQSNELSNAAGQPRRVRPGGADHP